MDVQWPVLLKRLEQIILWPILISEFFNLSTANNNLIAWLYVARVMSWFVYPNHNIVISFAEDTSFFLTARKLPKIDHWNTSCPLNGIATFVTRLSQRSDWDKRGTLSLALLSKRITEKVTLFGTVTISYWQVFSWRQQLLLAQPDLGANMYPSLSSAWFLFSLK